MKEASNRPKKDKDVRFSEDTQSEILPLSKRAMLAHLSDGVKPQARWLEQAHSAKQKELLAKLRLGHSKLFNLSSSMHSEILLVKFTGHAKIIK